MPTPFITASEISKTLGTKNLFEDLSFGVNEKERIGLIGTNGAGKSTLLKILSQEIDSDSGELIYRNKIKISYVPQEEEFLNQDSISDVLKNALTESSEILSKEEIETRTQIHLSFCGFEDFSEPVSQLSGGWKKRLSLAKAFAHEPDLLLLDEPTNHLDWEGIFWLENTLKNNHPSFIVISHDRDFINNLTNKTIEIGKAFEKGYLSFPLPYYKFIEQKEELLNTQRRTQKSLENTALREDKWLKAGVKARTTKNQGRIKEAHKLFNDLDDLKQRNNSVLKRSQITIQASDRKTKKLIEVKDLNVGYSDLKLIGSLTFTLGPKTTLGLVGHNGCGKTSLIRALLSPDRKGVKHAKDIQIVYFSQDRESLPEDSNLMDYLGDGSRYVIFKDQNIHVASYASQFLFGSDKMTIKISELSGGERARLSLAKILLKPCDVLILDEPTNDLDVETIEVLENIIEQFNGLCILVSHDRKFLKKLCSKFLYLSGNKDWTFYASLGQCLDHLKNKKKNKTNESINISKDNVLNNEYEEQSKSKQKLSYLDKKFLNKVEKLIEKEEEKLNALNSKLTEASSKKDTEQIKELSIEISYIQKNIKDHYAKWEELES